MKNKRLHLIKKGEAHAYKRNKLIRLYNTLRKEGGWRAVAKERNSKNQQYIYNFAVHGIEPPESNLVERKACFLYKEPKPYDPLSRLPKWLKRTPEALAWFTERKQIIRSMNSDTREALKKR